MAKTKVDLGNVRGLTGRTPRISADIRTGPAGSEAEISVTGTPEEPTIHFAIPRGDPGGIDGLTVNGNAPDESGNVTLTARDVGARPDTWTPSAEDVGAYPEGGIRTVALSLAVSAWTGSGPFAATIPRGDVTARTWIDIRLSAASMGNYSASIGWETSAGQIVLTTAARPTGVIEGTLVLMEVVA